MSSNEDKTEQTDVEVAMTREEADSRYLYYLQNDFNRLEKKDGCSGHSVRQGCNKQRTIRGEKVSHVPINRTTLP